MAELGRSGQHPPADLRSASPTVDHAAKVRDFIRGELGLKPRHLQVYEQSFTHRSWVHEQGLEPHHSNERLEFLGDVVLGLAVTEALLTRYSTADEGDLSKMKAQLGSRATLGEVGRRLDLGRFLKMGRGEEHARSQNLASLLGNAMEALTGAIFLDLGYETAAKFVVNTLEPEFARDLVALDYKSVLQEFAQRRFRTPPHYQVLRTVGPEHRKTFEVLMKLNGRVYGRGRGHTKKDAEQDAARHTLQRFGYKAGEVPQQPEAAPLADESKAPWWWPFGKRKERLI